MPQTRPKTAFPKSTFVTEPLPTSSTADGLVIGTHPAEAYSNRSDTTYVPAGRPSTEKLPSDPVILVTLSQPPPTSVPFSQMVHPASPASPSSHCPFRFQS